MLNKHSGIPLHIQLATLLRDQIRGRQLMPHTQLPSERELCETYGVSRITVRDALDELSREGLIYKVVGKGTYVADWTLKEELQPLSSFSDDLKRRGMEVANRVLEARVVPADDALAAQLRLPRGAEVVRLHRLRLGDGVPIALQLSHLPHHLCPGLAEYDFAARSLFETLRTEYRLRLTHADTVISAALAQAEEARLLQLPAPSAVLISAQTTYLEDNTIIEVTRSVFRADRYQLHMTC